MGSHSLYCRFFAPIRMFSRFGSFSGDNTTWRQERTLLWLRNTAKSKQSSKSYNSSLLGLDVVCGKPARRRYCMGAFSCIRSSHAYSYIQQSGRTEKLRMPKIRKKSPIHENADANITCDFGDGDTSRYRSRFTHTGGHTHASLARL